MRPSVVQTMSVPALGLANPARVIQAATAPMRVLVRNTGGALIFLALDSQDVSKVNSNAGTYQLPGGQSDVIVLAPKQSLFAAALGGGGTISIAASEAIPLKHDWMES